MEVLNNDPSEPSEKIVAEPAVEIEIAEQIQPTQIPPQLPPKGKGGRYRKRTIFNFQKRKIVNPDQCPTEKIKERGTTEPPEKWSACRLRRQPRELLRDKIAALAEDEKQFKLKLKRESYEERSRIAKAKHEEKLLQKEALAKFSSVKVKEEQQASMDVHVKVEPAVDIGLEEEPSLPLECEKLTCRKRQKRRETKRNKFYRLQRNDRKNKATQREERLLQQEGLEKLGLVKVEDEQQVDTDVKVELHDDVGHVEEKSQMLECEKLTSKKRRKLKEKQERVRRLQRNKKVRKVRRLESETEVERLLRLERLRMARVIRLATETEEEKSLRLERLGKRRGRQMAKAAQHEWPLLQQNDSAELSLMEVNEDKQLETDGNIERQVDIGSSVEQSQLLEREKLTCKKRRKRREKTAAQRFRKNKEKEKLRNETEAERSSRLEGLRIVRATRLTNETEEQRFVRLELIKMARLKRLVTETEEEKSLRRESYRRAAQRRKLKLENLRVARIQELLLQQMELATSVVEMKEEEDPEADIGDDFEIGKFIPKVLLHEGSTTESKSPTKSSTPPRGTRIKKEAKFDVVSNLLHSICGKSHTQQRNRLQRFDDLCTSRSSNYILLTVVWHKLNGTTNASTDGNLIEPIHPFSGMEIKAKTNCVDVPM